MAGIKGLLPVRRVNSPDAPMIQKDSFGDPHDVKLAIALFSPAQLPKARHQTAHSSKASC